jgi:2-polyprenyl-3-methyl-5-hydroxy-6-metoxy-1,4-benzoquinol methylase
MTDQSNTAADAADHRTEVERGERFAFGANWRSFLRGLNEARIVAAERSLARWLETESLQGLRLLDIGSGSGLFSLAARRLGADVHSFDYDPDSVACTGDLKRRHFDHDGRWHVEQGSVLDPAYMTSLGEYDIVYSWGVLHHTGSMWKAIEAAASRVRMGGRLFIAIYNDQGGQSRRWLWIKRAYNALPAWLRPAFFSVTMLPRELLFLMVATLKGRPGTYFTNIRQYDQVSLRGMSYWYDLIDWVGGLPFEVAKPEQIIDFLHARGFQLRRLSTCGGGLGCNEFVFVRA